MTINVTVICFVCWAKQKEKQNEQTQHVRNLRSWQHHVCIGSDNIDSWEEINPDTTTWLNDDVGALMFPTMKDAQTYIQTHKLDDCQPKKVADFISENTGVMLPNNWEKVSD